MRISPKLSAVVMFTTHWSHDSQRIRIQNEQAKNTRSLDSADGVITVGNQMTPVVQIFSPERGCVLHSKCRLCITNAQAHMQLLVLTYRNLAEVPCGTDPATVTHIQYMYTETTTVGNRTLPATGHLIQKRCTSGKQRSSNTYLLALPDSSRHVKLLQ